MSVIVNILYMLEMLRWIDSSDHLRRSIVPGKNNLSGILWMWNPLMRFLLFLHYTHIVSARWGPVLVRAGPGLALWGVITKQGGTQDPVLNSPSWRISFRIKDQYWGRQRVQHRTHLASNRYISCRIPSGHSKPRSVFILVWDLSARKREPLALQDAVDPKKCGAIS